MSKPDTADKQKLQAAQRMATQATFAQTDPSHFMTRADCYNEYVSLATFVQWRQTQFSDLALKVKFLMDKLGVTQEDVDQQTKEDLKWTLKIASYKCNEGHDTKFKEPTSIGAILGKVLKCEVCGIDVPAPPTLEDFLGKPAAPATEASKITLTDN